MEMEMCRGGSCLTWVTWEGRQGRDASAAQRPPQDHINDRGPGPIFAMSSAGTRNLSLQHPT